MIFGSRAKEHAEDLPLRRLGEVVTAALYRNYPSAPPDLKVPLVSFNRLNPQSPRRGAEPPGLDLPPQPQ